MSSFVEPSRSRAVSRLALLVALAAGLAGCSSDFSRFGDSQWASKPQASPDVTGSVQPAPAHKVETSALPPPTRQDVTGSVSTHLKQPAPAWSWDGGTAIIVAQGETIDTISRRHGVPGSRSCVPVPPAAPSR